LVIVPKLPVDERQKEEEGGKININYSFY
jgi:hypothetical protein